MRQWEAKRRRIPVAFAGRPKIRRVSPRSIWNQKARRMAGSEFFGQIKLDWKMEASQ